VVLGGGFFTCSLLLTSLSQGFWTLLFAFIMFAPASGAFVSLSQATLADRDPRRREQNMARWELAGAMGVLAGSIAIAATAAVEIDWRIVFLALAAVSLLAVALVSRAPVGVAAAARRPEGPLLGNLRDGVSWSLRALRRPDVLRWLVLLELSDLVGDVLLGYLALYLTDVAGANPAEAAVGVGIWTTAGLVGDVLVVVLLERMRGLTYLRINGAASLVLLILFLLAPGFHAKMLVGALLGLVLGGRYAILQAQLYAAVPGRSAAVLALNNIANLVGGLLPAAIGMAAATWGLSTAMWLVAAGPLALLMAVPSHYQGLVDVE
jgi:MFS transporter, FSR family, fosmidomycin resistance protein